MKQHLANMLRASAEADRQKALLTIELLSSHSAGIGDHSTGDFYSNAEEALQMLVDADDRIAAIEKYLTTQI
jgi:CubicO group peptidase (beta-lactamase class C family)